MIFNKNCTCKWPCVTANFHTKVINHKNSCYLRGKWLGSIAPNSPITSAHINFNPFSLSLQPDVKVSRSSTTVGAIPLYPNIIWSNSSRFFSSKPFTNFNPYNLTSIVSWCKYFINAASCSWKPISSKMTVWRLIIVRISGSIFVSRTKKRSGMWSRKWRSFSTIRYLQTCYELYFPTSQFLIVVFSYR